MRCPCPFLKNRGFLFALLAVIMIAATYSYYQKKFTSFNFVDFRELVFYESGGGVFAPTSEAFILIVFNSSSASADSVAAKIDNKLGLPIVAIDLSQNFKNEPQKGAIVLTADMNALLGFVHKLHITHSPCAVLLSRQKDGRYKQASAIESF